MQAICAGEFWHGASARALAQGLRELGWIVQEIDFAPYFLRGEDKTLRIASRLLTPASRRSFNRAILRAAEPMGGGVFIALKGSYLELETIRALQAGGTKCLIYYPDVNFNHPDVRLDVIREVDFLFTTKSYQLPFLDELRGPGRSALVHHGYSPLVHRPHVERVTEGEYRYDIAYVGNPDPWKVEMMQAVARHLPKLRMIVVGHGWAKFAAGTPLASRIATRALTGDLMAEIVQRSRINIAVQGRPNDPRGWYDHVSTRTFEIPACKGFMLHEDNREVRGLFTVGSEIDAFDGAEALCERIEFYIDRPQDRAEILERGYRRAVPAYSYYERAREIAAIADQPGAER